MGISRRVFMRNLLASSAAACSPWIVSCANADEVPNFIIFLADDLGYGDLGCYGNPIIQTPNIDEFASQGMRLTDCHSAGAVCSPSRAGLLTGRNPYRLGFYYIASRNAYLNRNEVTIASLLQKNGYDTCFVGKWHLGDWVRSNNIPDPGEHGFDHWFATPRNAFEGPKSPTTFQRNGKNVAEVRGWYCDVIVAEAVHWLESRANRNKPFFLFVSTHEPHTPIDPPESFSDAYDNAETEALEKTIKYGRVARPGRDISSLKKYYYGTVTQLDQAFGNLMQSVRRLGHEDNSLTFFTSDNGPESPVNLQESRGEWEDPIRDRCFGSPGSLRGMKRFPYEGGHRVPGILRWPRRIGPGVVHDGLVNGTDIMPTFCELVKVDLPADRTIDGASIVSLMSGGGIHRTIPQCWFFPAYEDAMGYMPHMAMRDGDYVLTGWFNEAKSGQEKMDWLKTARLERFELYDLLSDLEQQHDISSQRPDLMGVLVPKMRKLWQDIQTEGPVIDF